MSANSVCFTPRTLREFLLCHSTLQGVLVWLALQWPARSMEIVDIYRTEEEEAAAGGVSGIHCDGPPYRAIDIRVSNLVNITTDAQAWADAIGAMVNAKYIYDPARPTKQVAFTQPHGTGPHVHLQVCPATTLRPGVTLNV